MEIEEAVALVKRLGELNQATNDALVIICSHLSQARPGLAEELQQTFRNLSAAAQWKPSRAMTELSNRLDAALSGRFDNVALDSLNLPSPEERRAAFRVISGARDLAEPSNPEP